MMFFCGCREQSTLFQIWLTCHKVTHFWMHVYSMIRVVLNVTLARYLWKALLHKPILNLTKNQKRDLWDLCSWQPVRCWIHSADVTQCLMWTMVHKKLTSILTNTHAKLLKVWNLWIKYNSSPPFSGKIWLPSHPFLLFSFFFYLSALSPFLHLISNL